MTDELSPEFLLFSEMLDDEENLGESSVSAFGEDGAILMDLRKALRSDGVEAALPDDFSTSTSGLVIEKFRELSWFTKSLLKAETVFQGEVFSRATLAWTGALTGIGLGSALVSWRLFGIYGAVLLVLSLCWGVVRRTVLPRMGDFQAGGTLDGGSPWFGRVFFVLPVLASFATSLLVGRALSNLGSFSLTFRKSENALAMLAVFGGGIVFLLLVNALTPSWRALCQKAKRSLKWSLAVQTSHGLWLAMALVGIVILEFTLMAQEGGLSGSNFWEKLSIDRLSLHAVGWGLFAGVFVAGLLSRIPTSKSESLDLARGFTKTAMSFLFAGLPIVLALLGFYELSLTRELNDPLSYERLVHETKVWLRAQKAIPPNENGWTELKDYFLKQEVPNGKFLDVGRRLRMGGDMYQVWGPETSDAPHLKTRAETAKKEFLSELPRIESALSKPQFTAMATQDLKASSLVPDFILARAVSQGLTSLAQESLQEGNAAEALGYIEDGLEWSKTVDDGTLISLMIGLAQTSIAYEPVEKFVLEAHPSRQQLIQLLDSLTKNSYQRMAYLETMKHEAYMLDGAMLSLQEPREGAQALEDMMGYDAWSLARLLPASYWESERKAYLNLILAQFQDWRDLGRPADLNLEDALPLSFAAQAVVPNWKRAQIQFCKTLSQQSALQLVTALEIYQRDHGSYPDSLDELVPAYLSEIPKDAISPNLWNRKPIFGYQRNAKGYGLTSVSPMYDDIGLETLQTYGPDGHYGLTPL